MIILLITLTSGQVIVSTAVFSLLVIIIGLMVRKEFHSQYSKYLGRLTEIGAGQSIQLNEIWLDKSFWPVRVFVQLGDDFQHGEFVYLLEARLEPKTGPLTLFRISNKEYKQLLVEGIKGLNSEFVYASRILNEDAKEYYFEKKN